MLNEKKLNAPKGVGVGSLFSGLIREVIPMSKSSINNLNKVIDTKSIKVLGKTLQNEAAESAINETLNLLKKKKIKKSNKHHLKTAAKNILSLTKRKKLSSLSKSKTKQNSKLNNSKKRKLKQNQGPKNKKKSLIDDDY